MDGKLRSEQMILIVGTSGFAAENHIATSTARVARIDMLATTSYCHPTGGSLDPNGAEIRTLLPNARSECTDYRATLTRAASKFPPKTVLPVGVAVPATGSAEVPAGSAKTPATTTKVPLDAESLAEALSNRYGGGFVVVAESTTVPPITPTPEPSSKPVPPQVTASSNFLPVGTK
jgi:hypothetical protein